ncbi:uncharacterized protein LOC105847257 isoform X2 [Hydra vulgaris]|uniref:Uncharacterized protein LOC105847257 isoform X2 n=2 Tax=Hydra vulgaris TaxID=6087 RepID=A0ABM4B314_HYDVU
METAYGYYEYQASEHEMTPWYPTSFFKQSDGSLMAYPPSFFNFIPPVYKILAQKEKCESFSNCSPNSEQMNKAFLSLAYPCHLHINCCVFHRNEMEEPYLLDKQCCPAIKAHRAIFYRNKIFVGSLARKTSPADLAQFFKKFGKVIAAKVIMDSGGNSKGYGFVSFASEDTVNSILSQGAIYMEKKRIAVAFAIRKKHDDEI